MQGARWEDGDGDGVLVVLSLGPAPAEKAFGVGKVQSGWCTETFP